jgi:BMFP domain-containing protein YqiC
VQRRNAFAPHWSAIPVSFADAEFCCWCFRTGSGIKAHMSNESIENLAKKLAESVPEGLRSMRDDLETNFQGVLQSGLSKLDLVTREEFEVQEAVLARTREKLERLETKLEEIESNL